MNKEKQVVVYKVNNIFVRIKNFFKNIFYKKDKLENVSKEYNGKEKNFKQDIVIKQDEEMLRILKLQEDYKKGLIEEEDISKEDYKKLLDLYDEQNKEIKEDIEKDKIQIKNMLERLKKKN